MSTKSIIDFIIGEKIEGFFLIKEVECRTASNNKNYLDFTLTDKTGEINAKLWHCTEKDQADYTHNSLVKVRGNVTQWRNNLQFIIEKIRLVNDEDKVSIDDFIPSAPISGEKMYRKVLEYNARIVNPDINIIVNLLLEENKEKLLYYPAAKSNHHSLKGGLLYHILTMLKIGESLSEIYTFINRDLLYAGIILHDIAKIQEMESSKLGIVEKYTAEGELLGHIVQCVKNIDRVAREIGVDEEISLLLQHMILAHHGEPDFGSPKRPMFPEAELLHYIDTIDTRMYDMKKTLDSISEGDFSERQWLLNNRKLYKYKIEKK